MFAKLQPTLDLLVKRLNQGKMPYIVSIAGLLLTTLWVYLSPRSLPAFLVFLAMAGLIYYF